MGLLCDCGERSPLRSACFWRHRSSPAPVVTLPKPIQVVVTVDGFAVRQPDPMFSDAVVPAADPLSFNWNEDRGLRRLRKTA